MLSATVLLRKGLQAFHIGFFLTMKYIPSIAFEEMSGSAKGVTAANSNGVSMMN